MWRQPRRTVMKDYHIQRCRKLLKKAFGGQCNHLRAAPLLEYKLPTLKDLALYAFARHTGFKVSPEKAVKSLGFKAKDIFADSRVMAIPRYLACFFTLTITITLESQKCWISMTDNERHPSEAQDVAFKFWSVPSRTAFGDTKVLAVEIVDEGVSLGKHVFTLQLMAPFPLDGKTMKRLLKRIFSRGLLHRRLVEPLEKYTDLQYCVGMGVRIQDGPTCVRLCRDGEHAAVTASPEIDDPLQPTAMYTEFPYFVDDYEPPTMRFFHEFIMTHAQEHVESARENMKWAVRYCEDRDYAENLTMLNNSRPGVNVMLLDAPVPIFDALTPDAEFISACAFDYYSRMPAE